MALKAYDAARLDVVAAKTNDSLLKIAEIMLERNVGSVLIEDKEGKIIGIITKNDLLRHRIKGRDWENTKAEVVMSSPVASCNMTDSLEDVKDIFLETPYSRLAVKDDEGKVVGVLKKKIVDRLIRVSLAKKFFR